MAKFAVAIGKGLRKVFERLLVVEMMSPACLSSSIITHQCLQCGEIVMPSMTFITGAHSSQLWSVHLLSGVEWFVVGVRQKVSKQTNQCGRWALIGWRDSKQVI